MNQETITFNMNELSMKLDCNFKMHSTSSYLGTHFHSEIELVSVISGDICFFGEENRLCLKEGDILFVNSGCLHRLQPGEQDATLFLAQIDIQYYFDSLGIYGGSHLLSFLAERECPPYRLFQKNSCPELAGIIEKIKWEYRNAEDSWRLFIRGCILQLIAVFFREGVLYNSQALEKNNSLAKIMPALDYIDRNHTEKITLDSISQTTNFDKFYFCKLFKDATGTTFIRYLNDVRVRQAAELLLRTEGSITEIMLASGFTEPHHFVKSFRKKYHCTPFQYRKLHHRQC